MKLELGEGIGVGSVPHSCTQLEVAVVYTDVAHTLAALREAATLARDLHAVLHLIVPEVVPYPLPLNRPPVSRPVAKRRFRVLLAGIAVETRVDIRLCREREDGLLDALDAQSIVVLGLTKRWWPTAEQRLAGMLRKHGHHVVEVACERN